MALLTKLVSSAQDDAQSPPRTNWALYISAAELAQLITGSEAGFTVALPKDTPLFDTVARIVLKLMPVELAERHAIATEHPGAPAVIAEKTREASKARLAELVALVGSDAAEAVLAEHKARGGSVGGPPA